MLKHTKIIATISDLRCDTDFIRQLYQSGMNVVRLNTAHMSAEGLTKVVQNIREVSNRIGILIDTKGPEIRTTRVESPIQFRTGDLVSLKGDPSGITSHDMIYVSYESIVHDMPLGKGILIDDGDLELMVIEKQPDCLMCEVQNDAVLGGRKSVNVPGVRINLPSLTDKDRANIRWAVANDLDFIAHSFVRSKQDVLDVQAILNECSSPIKIIAKIENQEGVDRIEEIMEAAYGVMIARGDLGIEVPAERVPAIQRMLIRKCIEAKRPVIVATQMLHSMITSPRPTRAEVNDVANAIYSRTDALMLSGETAYGKYPMESVQTMTRIIREAEQTKLGSSDIRPSTGRDDLDITSFLAKQAVKSSLTLNVKAIVNDCFSGRTARYLSAFRGEATVFAICSDEKVMRMLSISYGVWAVFQPWNENRREYIIDALNRLLESGRIKRGDKVAHLSGSFGSDGGTTFLEINEVDKIFSAGIEYKLPAFKV